MTEHAICIRCGAEKAHPASRCGACSFKPAHNSIDIARSFYLSEFRFSGPIEMEQWLVELDVIAAQLRRGEPYEYDSGELERMQSLAQSPASRRATVAYRALCRFLIPGLLTLISLVALYLWLRLAH
jgi:hypothetical protein